MAIVIGIIIGIFIINLYQDVTSEKKYPRVTEKQLEQEERNDRI
jgi:uncharacterized protein YneF (UPF0154 family)